MDEQKRITEALMALFQSTVLVEPYSEGVYSVEVREVVYFTQKSVDGTLLYALEPKTEHMLAVPSKDFILLVNYSARCNRCPGLQAVCVYKTADTPWYSNRYPLTVVADTGLLPASIDLSKLPALQTIPDARSLPTKLSLYRHSFTDSVRIKEDVVVYNEKSVVRYIYVAEE
ncbi:hypothetical protein phiFa_22 [Thermus phage phiFa]|nr:hypothetical protein phiFa_22 [Thermus phage phiFa]